MHNHPNGIPILTGIALAVLGLLSSGTMAVRAEKLRPNLNQNMYIGTYTGGASRGIYRLEFNPATGEMTSPQCVAETPSPSFLALHPSGKWLYAVNEVSDFKGQKSGAVTAYAVKQGGSELVQLNQQPTGGAGPCHLTVDRRGRHVLVANYGGGSVTVLPLDRNGQILPPLGVVQHQGSSVNRQRQAAPHAHGIYLDPPNRFAFVPDLGLDRIMIYRYDARRGLLAGSPEPASIGSAIGERVSCAPLAPGAGPRHLAIHPSARWLYVINELNSTITAFDYDIKQAGLREIQTVTTLPDGWKRGNSTAEIAVHPSGRFLYGSNRGHDSIVVYSIQPRTGMLALRKHVSSGGRTPRNFAIDLTGEWLCVANQDSDSLRLYRIDLMTGDLTATGQTVSVGKPVCVLFAPSSGE
ncbi:MAG TPA: lactonase family protein [Candidatus Paceibacterota bacterium]|nr:lactonase family protein [Verrucomicrobiota bacterium]HRY47680.1 lactonase family protein [Candidatus Paceibacterota bacterium]HSA01319.1 lactonase family protein [Candidatus Paceibacterota bacterium]